jgi:hypothetical protein
MTQTAFNTHQNLDDLSDTEMLEIAYQLNQVEPGAGGVMPESAMQWADSLLGPLGGFGVFMIVTVASVALILAAPTLIKECRAFLNKPKTIRN